MKNCIVVLLPTGMCRLEAVPSEDDTPPFYRAVPGHDEEVYRAFSDPDDDETIVYPHEESHFVGDWVYVPTIDDGNLCQVVDQFDAWPV